MLRSSVQTPLENALIYTEKKERKKQTLQNSTEETKGILYLLFHILIFRTFNLKLLSPIKSNVPNYN